MNDKGIKRDTLDYIFSGISDFIVDIPIPNNPEYKIKIIKQRVEKQKPEDNPRFVEQAIIKELDKIYNDSLVKPPSYNHIIVNAYDVYQQKNIYQSLTTIEEFEKPKYLSQLAKTALRGTSSDSLRKKYIKDKLIKYLSTFIPSMGICFNIISNMEYEEYNKLFNDLIQYGNKNNLIKNMLNDADSKSCLNNYIRSSIKELDLDNIPTLEEFINLPVIDLSEYTTELGDSEIYHGVDVEQTLTNIVSCEIDKINELLKKENPMKGVVEIDVNGLSFNDAVKKIESIIGQIGQSTVDEFVDKLYDEKEPSQKENCCDFETADLMFGSPKLLKDWLNLVHSDVHFGEPKVAEYWSNITPPVRYKKIYVHSMTTDGLDSNVAIVTCNNEWQKMYIKKHLALYNRYKHRRSYIVSKLLNTIDKLRENIRVLEIVKKNNTPECGGGYASLEEHYKARLNDYYDQLVGAKRAYMVITDKMVFDQIKIEIV